MSEIHVEVVYALPERQYLRSLTLEEGSSIELAIRNSGVLALWPEIDLNINKIGIFSRPAKLGDVLRDGDRVEIYRPLLADPKELRRQRAERSKNKAR
ncbi:RnfH family protein [Musicola keenii]|uniref:RnfH family protein n=1 Tax=Musicola keenii TaxID=2884250 RepID=UPI00177E1929